MKHLAIYGACGGMLIVAMRFFEYRFLVVQHSFEIYAALIAAAFAAVGIWLGRKTRVPGVPGVPGVPAVPSVLSVPEVLVVPAVPKVFVPDQARIDALGITPREFEVLQLMAEGLSNKEMAERMFVSENTVKTHASRVFDKLGASRRTQAVQLAKGQGLLA